jgi:putative ABC transport system substrate-binding protein
MKRREFITLLGGSAATWPLVARAQQSERVRRIGALMSVAADHPEAPARVGAFSQGLAELGWTIGRNARIDIRWGTADPERIRKYAAELVALAPDVFLTVGSATTGPLLQATRADRVRAGRRTGRRRLRRNPRPAGRQHHRFHQFRIRDGKQMATPHAGLERSNERTTKQSEQLDTNLRIG